jgi:hypothetical protein
MYIDPDRCMVDFPADEFICGAEAWQQLRRHDLDVHRFRSAFFTEEQSILDMLRLDLHYALGEEILYFEEAGAPNVPKMEDLTLPELRALDRIAALLYHAGSHTRELSRLRDSVSFLR